MKCTLAREVLERELSFAQALTSRNRTLPAIGMVRLTANGQSVEIVATDLQSVFRTVVTATVEASGEVLVPSAKLYELARVLPDGEMIEIIDDAATGQAIRVTASAFTARLLSIPLADFPSVPTPHWPAAPDGWLPNCARLAAMITQVSTALGREDDMRYSLSGALYERTATGWTLVATDRYRLARVATQAVTSAVAGRDIPSASASASVLESAIIHGTTMRELARLLDAADADTTLRYGRDDSRLFFGVGARTLTSRVVEGTFPAYRLVIPAPATLTRHLSVDRVALADAVGRVALLADARQPSIVLSLGPNGIMLRAQAGSSEATDYVVADYEGESLEVRVRASYLVDFLRAATAERITAGFSDATAATLWQAAEPEYAYDYVLMPMRE